MKPFLLAFLLAATLPAQAADVPSNALPVATPTVEQRLAKAREAVASKDWNNAMRELTVAVREAPQNADVHNLLGYTYRKRATPDLARAFQHYNMALKFDPSHKGAHEYIGEAYLMEKRLAQAEQHLAELERICGNRTCEEYEDLAKAIADFKSRN